MRCGVLLDLEDPDGALVVTDSDTIPSSRIDAQRSEFELFSATVAVFPLERK